MTSHRHLLNTRKHDYIRKHASVLTGRAEKLACSRQSVVSVAPYATDQPTNEWNANLVIIKFLIPFPSSTPRLASNLGRGRFGSTVVICDLHLPFLLLASLLITINRALQITKSLSDFDTLASPWKDILFRTSCFCQQCSRIPSKTSFANNFHSFKRMQPEFKSRKDFFKSRVYNQI